MLPADDSSRCPAGPDVSRHDVRRVAVSCVYQRGTLLLPLMFQVGFGMNAFHAGSLVLAVFVGNLTIKPATTPLIRWLGFKSCC